MTDEPKEKGSTSQAMVVANESAVATTMAELGLTVLTGEYRGWTNRMKIAGTTGNEYTVSMRVSNGEWGCSCPGWIFRRTCDHLNTMLPTLVKAFPGSRASEPLGMGGRVGTAVPPAPALPPAPPGETHAERVARLVAFATQPPPGPAPRAVPALPTQASQQRPLTDAEAKRRERIRKISSGEIYRKVAPGSADQWAAMAAAFMAGDVNFQQDARAYAPNAFKARPAQSPVLATLFLEEMPNDPAGLRSAYRGAVMRAFQDVNYVDTDPRYVAAFARITTAYEALKTARRW